MANITYTMAIAMAIEGLDKSKYGAVIDKLTALKVAVEKRNAHRGNNEATNEKRRQANAAKRAATCEPIIPIIKSVLVKDMTATEIYEAGKELLPADFTPRKVSNILNREMANMVIKTEIKNKASMFRMKEGA